MFIALYGQFASFIQRFLRGLLQVAAVVVVVFYCRRHWQRVFLLTLSSSPFQFYAKYAMHILMLI